VEQIVGSYRTEENVKQHKLGWLVVGRNRTELEGEEEKGGSKSRKKTRTSYIEAYGRGK